MILFPADTLERAEVERDYRAEWDAAQNAGFLTAIFDFDGLRRDEPIGQILRRVPLNDSPQTLIYRGWMLVAEDYARLFDGLTERGWRLFTSPDAYEFAHYAPRNSNFWRLQMAQTRSIPREEFERNGKILFGPINRALRPFGSDAVIVKDWVKSRKHEWNEACFIPDASDKNAVKRIVDRFLEGQGESFVGGLVFRRFENLRPGEWRSFWFDGQLLSLSPNPKGDEKPQTAPFDLNARVCLSRFFSLDLAQKESGEWIVIEMGDGSVSGLPSLQDENEWYRALKRGLSFPLS